MRVALFLVALVLAGCGPSASEKAAQERISAAARATWSEGIDAAGLADSLRLCATVQSRDCIEVEGKAQAVADAVASCSNNDSALCQAVSNTKSLLQFKGGSASRYRPRAARGAEGEHRTGEDDRRSRSLIPVA